MVLAAWVAGALGWAAVVHAAYPPAERMRLIAVVAKSQVAKYLPGNVFQYVGRVSGASSLGVPATVSALSIMMEAAFAAAAALLIGLTGYVGDIELLTEAMPGGARPFLVATGAAGAGAAAFIVIALLSTRISGVVRSLHAVLRPRPIAEAFLLYLASQVLLSLAMLVLLTSMFATVGAESTLRLIAAASFAWVTGFLTPGSPGGLGVREAVFVALAGPEIGTETALAGALVLRFATVLVDLVVFGSAILADRRWATPEQTVDSQTL